MTKFKVESLELRVAEIPSEVADEVISKPSLLSFPQVKRVGNPSEKKDSGQAGMMTKSGSECGFANDLVSQVPFACRPVALYLLVSSFLICYFLLSTASAHEISSRAAVVIDASTGKILYARNPDLKLAPASTTKLMTAIVTIENADLKDVVRISRHAAAVSPHKAGFKAGDRINIEKLLYAALVGSANDAAVALAEGVAGSEAKFVEMMNRKATEIGADNTRFINPHGLPGPGQYITASDLSKIMTYALRYAKLKEIIGTRVTAISTQKGRSIFLKNTNRLLWSDDELVGGKTGYTRKARHCFVCAAERQNDTVIVAVLGSPSRSRLWKDSETLIVKGFDLMEGKGEPVVYVSKADDESPVVERVSYKKTAKHRMWKSKSKRGGKIVRSAAGHKKKMYADKKRKAKALARHRSKKRNYNVAEKSGNDGNKG